jgi:hypothetical protein
MACVAVSDAADGDAEGLPDALAAGVLDDDEQPASAPAVMAMVPHWAREIE